MLTQEFLKDILSYAPETGVFTWLIAPSQRTKVGMVAGGISTKGYRKIRVGGARCSASRIAFLYMTGRHPKGQVDHVNGVRSDDRWENLRECTNGENQCNSGVRKDSGTGFKGVKLGQSRYIARISKNGKRHYLGSFSTPEEAHKVYCEAADRLHGEFKNYGPTQNSPSNC
jgi:hypothetical protein